MSAWNKDLSSYIWPWFEPIFGVLLLINGVKTVVTGEFSTTITHQYHYRTWLYHGPTAEFAGILLLLGAYLVFRGRIWRRRGWSNWTIVDRVIGAIIGAGFLFFIALRWIAILK